MKYNKKITIATGGTGGHIFPAYSLAQHFKKKDYDINVVTDKRGFKILKNYKDIRINIINSRKLDNKNILNALISIFQISLSIIFSVILLTKLRPRLILGMGGYSSFPVCIAAKILRIPFIIYENNLHIGKANKYLLPLAKKMLVSYKELEGVNKKYILKTIEIGNIIRNEILQFKPLTQNKNQDLINIIVIGGSQAAKVFAEILPEIFKKCKDENIKLKIYQQCLSSQKEKLEKDYRDLNIDCEIFNFNLNLLSYFDKIDLAITRSGSSMLAELLNCCIPFISIPFKFSADNHQLKNAKFYEKKKYGFLVKENEISEKLFPLIKSIHRDRNLLSLIKKKQSNYTDKFVFKKIDNEIKEFFYE